MNEDMPPRHYEQLLDWLGICRPVVHQTLADCYDPESAGCRCCVQRDKACKFLLDHPEYV